MSTACPTCHHHRRLWRAAFQRLREARKIPGCEEHRRQLIRQRFSRIRESRYGHC